ncbi:MFS transporter [Niallia sp. XMNu-256]|uniref:MFS transporter n=1 Tax=Niallia sp. XMNu-256 TaxID=3082444 RepID=UPI0030D50D07
MDHVEELKSFKISKAVKKKRHDTHNKKWAILSMASIPLIMTLGNSMFIPVLTQMQERLNISSFQSSMIITVYSIVAIILIPLAGYLSDHIGRKKVIIPSLIITGLGGLVSGWAAWKLADAYWVILMGRALQGVGAAGASPIVMPLVGDMFKSEEEVSSTLGIIETSNTFGKVLSPILGSIIAGIVWFLPFFAIPVFCLISTVLVWFLVKTPNKREKPIPFKQFFKNIKKTFAHNGKWLNAIFLIGAIMMFVLFGVLFYLTETLETQYHIDGVKKGLYLAIPLGALCLTSYFTGRLIKENKVLMKWIIFSGSVLLSLSVAVLSFSNRQWFLIALFLFCGIGIGAVLPCLDALITSGIEKEHRGTITSIYNSMRFIGVAAGPPVLAILMGHTGKLLFYILCGFSVLSALLTFMAIKPDEKDTAK